MKMYNVPGTYNSLFPPINIQLDGPHMFVSFAGAFKMLGYNLSSCIHICFAK